MRSILSGAPELLSAPGTVVGLAQGLSSPQTPDNLDPQQVGAAASLAAAFAGVLTHQQVASGGQ